MNMHRSDPEVHTRTHETEEEIWGWAAIGSSLGRTRVVAPAEKVSTEQDLETTQVRAGRGKS